MSNIRNDRSLGHFSGFFHRFGVGKGRRVSAVTFTLVCMMLLVAPGQAANAQTSQNQREAQSQSPANTSTSSPVKTLVVATKDAPPFAMKNAQGQWEGMAIDLWRDIATDMGVAFTFKETTLQGVLEGAADRSTDVGVAAMTITSEREKTVDFSQPYYVTGLGIAVPTGQKSGFLSTLRQFVSWAFFQAVLALVTLLLVAGLLVWIFERRHQDKQFGGKPREGLMSGFWWAAVTMTTVGYGDKAPATTGGRLVGLVWMFTSIIIISSFTAAIASSLTLNQLQGPVQGPEDLPNVRVGTLVDSTSLTYLKAHRVPYVGYDSSADALQALSEGRLDAVVYDEPILRYQIKQNHHGKLRVLPGTFDQQYYGLVLPQDSPYREQINQSLLQHINDEAWTDRVKSYLGN